ncbi:elongation factor P 5-aminopentanone reductase [Lactobacillus kalixensis]|uniref:3-oxoacyl-[acyl-carrier-protein] reductase n=1 Tax=Lactobacillus kalixensis DSM 16043 TaxID=1423763 RepID=A0A0R1UE48_9LACO|nr:SDR family oxidoreductase [Lactobacillus kalixensis]KRL91582.1 3-oxoacyl-[acyl-carrier-protein] reductase [Lactobacillus kalixensis DSM 16043]
MRRAVVFGATGGIGETICQDLARAGWSLYVHYCHDQPKAEKISQELMKEHPNQDFMTIQFDFASDHQQMKQFIQSLLPVNAVVFAQGITKYGFLNDQKLTEIEKVIQINLTTPIELTKLFEATLLKQDFSRIVYLGSVYGGQGSALESVYSATKAGLSRFAQAYSREVASTGLSVNVVAPGAVNTPMNAMFSKEVMNEVQEEIPAGRLAEGKDIAYWVKTLLEPESSYCTGQTIYVSGGWLL